MSEILIQAEIPATPEAVWAVFTDHRGWERWAGVREVVLRHEGDPPPNGVGASRVIRASGIAVEEEVVAFEPPKRMVYRLIAGIPVRDHEAEVRFEPTQAGTLVVWRVRFRPLIPFTGRLIARFMRSSLRGILARLATYPF